MSYVITQRYLPSGRGDIPALTPAEADTRFTDPGEMQGTAVSAQTVPKATYRSGRRDKYSEIRIWVDLIEIPSLRMNVVGILFRLICNHSINVGH